MIEIHSFSMYKYDCSIKKNHSDFGNLDNGGQISEERREKDELKGRVIVRDRLYKV